MSKLVITATILNALLLLLMIASTAGFLSFANFYGVFLATVSAVLAWGIFKNNSKAYFGTAVWGLACFQLAKQGYEFQMIKNYVMGLGILVIPSALFLHEVLGKQPKITDKKTEESQKDKNLPL